LRELDLCFSI